MKTVATCILALMVMMGLLYETVPAQQLKNITFPVKSAEGSYFSYPWAGGMNSCQFGQVDMDLDGKKDLLVFDRTGNRLMPFLNRGDMGQIAYEYAPEFVSHFPVMYDWVILADYDLDGKEDIFTYSPGYAGMKVYHNISSQELEFEVKVSPFLTSFQGGGYTNILVTYADYPGIADIDGDGDLDILTFWGLGAFVEMHKNLSYEKYGTYDSLDYEKTGLCWGYFAESEESNELYLDTCVGWKGRTLVPEDISFSGTPSQYEGLHLNDYRLPHTGSTFLILDLQGDQVMDVLLGDVDYPGIIALENEGTKDSAYIGNYSNSFPEYDRGIEIFSMPAVAYLDLNNDGVRDMVASAFDPNPFIGANKYSSWLYVNDRADDFPDFNFIQDDFIQEEMIDVGAGCYPVFEDYDADGLADMFIGNYGYYDSSWYDQNHILHTHQTGKIALFKNIGSKDQPIFTYITDDFSGLSGLNTTGLMPAFGDLDGDGDLDMLSGKEDGHLCLFENTAGPDQEMHFELLSDNFDGIDVGDYSTAQLFDLDKDGTTDLVIGERGGTINYYKGLPGEPWQEFSLVSDFLGEVNITDPDISLYGYSVPHFFEDSSGNTLLLVGSEQGEIFFFNEIDGNLDGRFMLSDTLGEMIGVAGLKNDFGYRSAACVEDLNNDGEFELVVGNFSGGLEFISNVTTPPVSGLAENESHFNVILSPNPARDILRVSITEYPDRDIFRIELYDSQGRLLYSESIYKVASKDISLAGYPAGLYFVRVSCISNQVVHRSINKKLIIFN